MEGGREPLVLIQQIRSIKPQIATDWRKLQRTKTTNTEYGAFTMLPEAADSDGIWKSTDVSASLLRICKFRVFYEYACPRFERNGDGTLTPTSKLSDKLDATEHRFTRHRRFIDRDLKNRIIPL